MFGKLTVFGTRSLAIFEAAAEWKDLERSIECKRCFVRAATIQHAKVFRFAADVRFGKAAPRPSVNVSFGLPRNFAKSALCASLTLKATSDNQ